MCKNLSTNVLKMIPSDRCKANQIASTLRTKDYVGCKRCEYVCPIDFLNICVYLGHEIKCSMGL